MIPNFLDCTVHRRVHSPELRKRLAGEKLAKTLALGFETGFVNSVATNVQRLLTVHKTEKGVEVAIFKAAGREMLASFLDFEAQKMKVRAGEEFAERWEGAATVATGIRVPKAVGDFLILRAIREGNQSGPLSLCT